MCYLTSLYILYSGFHDAKDINHLSDKPFARIKLKYMQLARRYLKKCDLHKMLEHAIYICMCVVMNSQHVKV